MAVFGPVDLTGGALTVFVQHVGEHHGGALGGEQPPLLRALAPCTPGDQCDLAVEPSHVLLPQSSLVARTVAPVDLRKRRGTAMPANANHRQGRPCRRRRDRPQRSRRVLGLVRGVDRRLVRLAAAQRPHPVLPRAELPPAPQGTGLLRGHPLRRHRRGVQAARDVLFRRRHRHPRPAPRVRRRLHLHDHHGRPPSRPAAADRRQGFHAADVGQAGRHRATGSGGDRRRGRALGASAISSPMSPPRCRCGSSVT